MRMIGSRQRLTKVSGRKGRKDFVPKLCAVNLAGVLRIG